MTSHGISKMFHPTDPREDLFQAVGDMQGKEILHNQVLVAIYIRPKKTSGGIELPSRTRNEDRYQGKVGLVISKGPTAFVDDGSVKFYGQNVDIGDWIAFRAQDGWSLDLTGTQGPVPCRMLEDAHVKMKLTTPDAIY